MLSLFYYVKRGGEIDILGLGRLGTHNYKIKAQIGTWLSDLILSSFYVQRSWEEDWSLTADWHPVQQCIAADYPFNNADYRFAKLINLLVSQNLTRSSFNYFREKKKVTRLSFHLFHRKFVLSIAANVGALDHWWRSFAINERWSRSCALWVS